MLAFFPDGYVQTKVNICSCNVCIKGEFTSCSHEVGKKLFFNMIVMQKLVAVNLMRNLNVKI